LKIFFEKLLAEKVKNTIFAKNLKDSIFLMVKTIKQALKPAFLKQKSNREEIELFPDFRTLL
jgi:hypothetical protein